MFQTISFRNIPNKYLESIQDNVIKNLYSRFRFLYLSLKNYREQTIEDAQKSIENLLFYSLKDFKFIIINLNENNQNKQKQFSNKITKNSKFINESIATDFNAFICVEGKYIIIEQVNLSILKSLINKLIKKEIKILNISSNFDIFKEMCDYDNDIDEEIINFNSNFQNEIKKNEFIKSTISSIIAYTIRRYYYPSHYFKDPTFLCLSDTKKLKEERIKSKLFKLLFSCPNKIQFVYQFIQILNDLSKSMTNDDQNEINEFQSCDFIKLRLIHSNEVAFYYLVIHRKSLHIFLLKQFTNYNKIERELGFCLKYYHRCFTPFYGLIKENNYLKSIIYEYMCNDTLNNNIEFFDPIFSLLTISRLFEGIEYLYSKSLIHRDLKPPNILLDNNFIPYIHDFETIRQPGTDKTMTKDIGSIYYISPEQYNGNHISYSTDIYSFGLIIYFLNEKKDFLSINPKEINYNKPNMSKNIQNLFKNCINDLQEKRPNHFDIKSAIIREINSLNFIELSKNTDINKKVQLIQLIYENFFIQNDKNEELNKWVFNVMNIYFSSHIFNYKIRNSNDLVSLGILYSKGQGVNQNFKKAKELFLLAACQYNSNAFFCLGTLYANGYGVKQNDLIAIQYYEQSANLNNSDALYNLGIIYSNGRGVQNNISKAIEYFKLAGKLNNSEALFCLGIIYLEGQGIKQDYLKAKEYFELSANQNNSEALLSLGTIYYQGNGVDINYLKAKEYFEKAAKQGNSNAFFYLGILYHYGQGVKQDYSRAKEFYEKAANMNNYSSALINLGILYSEGKGVEQNFLNAKNYFEKAALYNDSDAFYNLGYLYQQGNGVKQDYGIAIIYYKKAAQQNHSKAFFNLGSLYYQGLGVNQNYTKARQYFELSAIKNNPIALLKLGYIYYHGKGVEQSYSKAKEYFEKSANQGNSDAFLNIGHLYAEGQGVEQNYSIAIEYYEKSANLGNSNAFYHLGLLYSDKQGVGQNYSKAVKYYEKSANLGNSNALFTLGTIFENGYYGPKDINKAKKYYELAAKQDNSFAYINLANLYKNGKGVSKDLSKMKELIEKAVQLKNSYALISLGDIYFYGLGVERNYKIAKENYEKAEKHNNSIAYLKLGKMYFTGCGVEKDLNKAQKYFQFSAQLNNAEAFFHLGSFYSNGDVFDQDINKAIENLNKCKEIYYNVNKVYDSDGLNFYLQKKYNIFHYRSMNDLGLIYITAFNDDKKAFENIKNAAHSEYPYAQNNLGLLYQFYLNDPHNAEYFYKRSSEHNFALAEYNLGYLKEKEGNVKEAFEFFIQASNHADEKLIFQGNVHTDLPLFISKEFIICFINIKLSVYFMVKSDYENSKKYFVNTFSKFIDVKNSQIQNQFKHILEIKGNFFSFLKFALIFCSSFNFINQPNLISDEELNYIFTKSNFLLNEDTIQQKYEKNNTKYELNDILKNIYFTKKLIKTKKEYFEYIENKEEEEIDEIKKNESNKSILIFKDLGELFDYISKDTSFVDEMNGIIETLKKILYKPPYDILFGRISIAKQKTKEKEEFKTSKNADKSFYDGFEFK